MFREPDETWAESVVHEKFRRGNGINRYNAPGLGRKPNYASKNSTDGDLAAEQMLRSGPPRPIGTIGSLPRTRWPWVVCRPRAPTDPYVPALEHTVPQIMALLRA